MAEIEKKKEGYVYTSYGDQKYLRHVVASVSTLRRYDQKRPVTIYCSDDHVQMLEKNDLSDLFDQIIVLPTGNRSITGFKHNVYQFMPYEKNLYMDSDIVWCKNPNVLWKRLETYSFTISGNHIADGFFGGPKGVGIIADIVLRRRKKTLEKFGLTYLNRVQTGMMYSSDRETAEKVCKTASEFLSNRDKTHFRSRKCESGRTQETCEWSLGMALSKLEIPILPWLNGYESPQLDYIEDYTEHNPDFTAIVCTLYNDRFVYDFKAIQIKWLRKFLISFFSLVPGKGDYMKVTPYCLHFGWHHQKQPFYDFADRVWEEMTK
ncbi:hypothetical protein [Rhodohalobacter sp.]|uniref:hypothetical protein n=1 Tax=Rhodohalobacter sp. TaxID=1974210 RepID=UPI002ACE116C|nr:hypothetical protein [Rhodohalobacter sp.]MDZ7755304.1 hypothetical protein [Rhodohalobacter sp.]